jgi:hypothetical protein
MNLYVLGAYGYLCVKRLYLIIIYKNAKQYLEVSYMKKYGQIGRMVSILSDKS